ncbi:MAG: CarD family transcriptional regulator [Candidatus Aminicenantes bacterium]
MFKIGDKVLYPNQGLGVIEDIQEEKHYGESFKIYRVRILANNTLVLVPSANASEIGIRKPIAEDRLDKIYKFMRNGHVDVTMNWKGRYKEHLDLMKTGSILDTALVLKSLYYLNLIKPLSFREKKMMEKAKNLMVSEMSEVSSLSSSEVEEKLLQTLALCFKNMQSQIDS